MLHSPPLACRVSVVGIEDWQFFPYAGVHDGGSGRGGG